MNSIVCEDLTSKEFDTKPAGYLNLDGAFVVETYPKASFKITKATAITNAKAEENTYVIVDDRMIKKSIQAILHPK